MKLAKPKQFDETLVDIEVDYDERTTAKAILSLLILPKQRLRNTGQTSSPPEEVKPDGS